MEKPGNGCDRLDEVYPTNKWFAGELGVHDTDVAQFTKEQLCRGLVGGQGLNRDWIKLWFASPND